MKLLTRRVQQGEVVFYQTAISALDLINQDAFRPDRWDTATNLGYQREVNDPHVRRIAAYLKKQDGPLSLLPTNVIVNYRQPLAPTVERNSTGEPTGTVTLEVPKSAIGYIVDGQHRVTALRKLHDDGLDLSGYELGVTVTQLSLADEMEQFRNINTSANRPPKGLSQIISSRLASEFGYTPESLSEAASNRAVSVVSRLTSDPNSPWYGLVAMGGMRKRSFHTTVQGQIVNSLLPLFTNGRFFDPTENQDHVYQLIKDFWLAVGEVFPEAINNPTASQIQRPSGYFALNLIMSRILTGVNPNPTHADYLNVLNNIKTALGLTSTSWELGGDLMRRRYGYSQNRGHSVLADVLWAGFDQRVTSPVN